MANTFSIVNLNSGAWEYPIWMTFGGIGAVYYDLYRRVGLEAICENEDLKDAKTDALRRFIREPLINQR